VEVVVADRAGVPWFGRTDVTRRWGPMALSADALSHARRAPGGRRRSPRPRRDPAFARA
jgi:hypothetical protein